MSTRFTSWLVALGAATAATATAASPPHTLAQDAVRGDLIATKAASAVELAPELSARPLEPGAPSVLPLGDGRTMRIPVVLAPKGGPFRVPTELGLTYSVAVADGRATIASRPSREDLATAVRLASKCEPRLLEAAGKALDSAGRRPPLGGVEVRASAAGGGWQSTRLRRPPPAARLLGQRAHHRAARPAATRSGPGRAGPGHVAPALRAEGERRRLEQRHARRGVMRRRGGERESSLSRRSARDLHGGLLHLVLEHEPDGAESAK